MDKLKIPVRDPDWGLLMFDARAEVVPDGKPVLLLHGFPQTSHLWEQQMSVLAAAGYYPVALDQRGYSPRARPEPVEAYRCGCLVRDVLAVADALGWERFHIVGHDWGGIVAWEVAGRHGDRLLSLTVLSSPHPVAMAKAIAGTDDLEGSLQAAESSGKIPATDQARRSSYMELFREEGSELGLLANDMTALRTLLALSGLSEEKAAPYLKAIGNLEALRGGLNWYRAADMSLIEGLGPVTVPTLYIWSSGDVALGPDAAHGSGAFVEGPYQFEILDGVSHWIADEVPDRVNELLLEHLGRLGFSRS